MEEDEEASSATADSDDDSSAAATAAAIADCVARRVRCTVRIRPLPNGCRLADLASLCPAARAVRLPWNRARRRHKGVAFLEFASPAAAAKHAAALLGSRALGGVGRELATSVRSDFTAAEVVPAGYSPRRVVVSSLQGRVTARQLLELAPGSQKVRFGPPMSAGRHAPGVAVVTFASAGQALAAVAACQGAEINGCRTSWMLEKLSSAPKPRHQVDRRTLVLTGVTKSMTDARLLAALPGCASLDRRPGTGTAVATYNTEAACAIDLAAWPTGGGPERLLPNCVAYGHLPHHPGSGSSASSAKTAGKKAKKQRQTAVVDRTRLVTVGLPAGTKKAEVADFIGGDGGLTRLALTSSGRLAVLSFNSEAAAVAARAKFRSAQFRAGVRVRTAHSLGQLEAMRKKRTQKAAAPTSASNISLAQQSPL